MGIFNNQIVPTEQNNQESAGLDLHLPYRPSDRVWTLSGGKAVQLRVIEITTKHRSLISDKYKPSTKVTVLLENSLQRDGSECFTTKEELIESL